MGVHVGALYISPLPADISPELASRHTAPEPQTEPEPQPEAELQPEPQPEAEPQPESKTQADLQSKPKAGSAIVSIYSNGAIDIDTDTATATDAAGTSRPSHRSPGERPKSPKSNTTEPIERDSGKQAVSKFSNLCF